MTKCIEDLIREIEPVVGVEKAQQLWDAGRAYGAGQYRAGYGAGARAVVQRFDAEFRREPP